MRTDERPSELAVNLWAYIDEASGMVYAISGKAYALAGSDEDKSVVLRQLAATDHLTAPRRPLPKNFTITDGQQRQEGMAPPGIVRDNLAAVFEGVYQAIESTLPPLPDYITGRHTPQCLPQEPLFLLTFLVEDDEGKITPVTSRDLSRQLAVKQVKREMMQTLGFSAADAEVAANQWLAEQDQQNR